MKQEQFERAQSLAEELSTLKQFKDDLLSCENMTLDDTQQNKVGFKSENRIEVAQLHLSPGTWNMPAIEMMMNMHMKQMMKNLLRHVNDVIALKEKEFERL
jgi:hypothetical protein